MATVNIDEQLWHDPRLEALAILTNKATAIGAVAILWRLGQEYWRKGKLNIPKPLYNQLPLSQELIKTGFVSEQENGFYCHGGEERWEYLFRMSQAGKKGGLARSRMVTVRSNDGRFVSQRVPGDTQALPGFESSEKPAPPSPIPIPIPIPSPIPLKTKNKELRRVRNGTTVPSVTGEVWETYKKEYEKRYHTEPVRNAKVNAQINQLVKRLGTEAADVVKFYVRHNQGFYVRSCHSVGICLQDAEALRTQWARGRPVMASEAQQVDKTQSNINSWDQARAIIAKRGEKTSE